jgi:hypothetical protein
MNSKRVFIPLLAGVAATLACGGGGDSALFRDDFSADDSGWTSGSSDTASIEFSGGEFVFNILESNWFIWSTPGEDDITDARIEVTARNVGGAADPTFGVICNYQNDDAFYYMGIGSDQSYGIVRVEGDDDIFLSSAENQWEFTDDIPENADSYTITGVCAEDGTLTLLVNGREVASAVDDTYTSGDVGLFALSFDQTPVEVTFDDFVVTRNE